MTFFRLRGFFSQTFITRLRHILSGKFPLHYLLKTCKMVCAMKIKKWRCTQEAEGTALEMRQVGYPARGFDSHHLRDMA